MAQKLSQSYYMQEKLATENAELETMRYIINKRQQRWWQLFYFYFLAFLRRYNLQEDLLSKDQTVESLQKKLHGLQAEMRMICKENQILSERLEKLQVVSDLCWKWRFCFDTLFKISGY